MFSGKPLAVGIALGLLLASCALYFAWLYPSGRRFTGHFKVAAAAIRKIRNATHGTQEERLALIQEFFERNALEPNWKQYRACLEFEDGRVYNYSDPEVFFSADRVPGGSYLKWSTTLGGVFLTLGLVFTFTGLSAALLQMGGDGQSLDPAQMRKAVEGILAVSSAKFITSIAGIVAYIGWTLVARVQANAQDHAVQRLCEELRLISTFTSPEFILRQQLKAIQRQEEQFQTFGNDLAVAIGRQIEVALNKGLETLPVEIGKSVAAAMNPLEGRLHEISSQIGRTGSDIVGDAGDSFARAWESGVGVHLEQFGGQMDKVVAALGDLPDKMRSTEEGFGIEIDRTTRQLSDTTKNLTESLQQTQASITAVLERFGEKIASIPQAIEGASKDAASAVSDAVKRASVESSTAAANAGSRSASELASVVARVAASLEESSQKLKDAGDHSANALKGARDDLTTGAAQGVEIITRAAKDASEELAQTVASLAAIVSSLNGSLDSATIRIVEQNTRLVAAGETVGSASQKLAAAAGSVEAATGSLSKSANSIEVVMTRVSETVSQLKSASDLSKSASDLLNESLGRATVLSAEQAKNFEILQRAIHNTTSDMVEKVQQLGTEISRCIDTYDREIADSIRSLETAMLDVADIVDNRNGAGN